MMRNMQNKWYSETINSFMTQGIGVTRREFNYKFGDVCILFINEITDNIMLVNYVIKPLMQYCSSATTKLTSAVAFNELIHVQDIKSESDTSKIQGYLLEGMTIVILSTDNNYLVINIKKFKSKAVEDPKLTFGIRSPKDAFTEKLEDNISLIRYRIKDSSLKIQQLKVGVRTQTNVAVVYIESIVNMQYVNDIVSRINNINTDGIIESGGIQSALLNKKTDLFPQTGLVERSDMACAGMLEGKVVILVEGSGIGLIAPKLFLEFLMSCDDNYDNKYMGIFNKIIRIASLWLALTITPFYIAITAFHYDILPTEYIQTLAISRATVPFNAVTEAFLVELILEILREGLIRVPSQIGQAIGIVGAIIIGQASISAGIFSPLILIIGSMSLLASFVPPDYTIANPIRILKFFVLVSTALLGFFGFVISICLIFVNIISTNSFGVPYFAPFAPFSLAEFFKTFIHNKASNRKRPGYLRNNDDVHGN